MGPHYYYYFKFPKFLSLSLFVLYLNSVYCYSLDNHESNGLNVVLDSNTGGFNITLNDQVWFGSSGKGISLRNNYQLYTIDNNSLIIDDINYGNGKDNWGLFKDISITYKTNEEVEDDIKYMIGIIKTYPMKGAIIFEQYIVNNLNNTSSGDSDGVITNFPIFDIDNNHIPDSSCLWTSWDQEFGEQSGQDDESKTNEKDIKLVAPGWFSPTCRGWTSDMTLPGGIAGTGPMVIWSEEAINDDVFPAFVLSPLENTMAINLDASELSSKQGRAAYGTLCIYPPLVFISLSYF